MDKSKISMRTSAPARRAVSARGQVLAPALLACLPLAVLLAAVARMGPAARDRMRLQTAADAGALAAATWEARACNLLAQAHQSEAQMAAGIALLRAVQPTRERAENALAALEAAGGAPPDALAAERRMLRDWEAGLADLMPLADPSNPSGLWAALETVESLRSTFLQALPPLAARDASAVARDNGADEVYLWPSAGALPVDTGAASELRPAALEWLARGTPGLTNALRPPLLSDARALYAQEARAALQSLVEDPSFPAHPAVWRRDARLGIDRVAFAVRARGETAGQVAFAQARPVNPERGDLATPRWTARLAPARRASQAWLESLVGGRREGTAPSLRLSPEAVEALNCH